MSWALAAAAAAGAAFSARFNWWRPKTGGLAVLMYHQIGAAPAAARLKKLWVSAADFRAQMLRLKEDGWTALTPAELAVCEDSGALPDKPALITFDDGYADNYETAFPILKELHLKAAVFLVVDALGGHNRWHDPDGGPWQRMLSLDQVKEMRDSGLIEFGSHTMSHRDLQKLPADEARWEIFESKRRLEALLGSPVGSFAYPYGSGAYAPGIRALAREAGYRYDFGIRQGKSPLPWDPASGPLKRLLIRGDDTAWDFDLNLTRGKARL